MDNCVNVREIEKPFGKGQALALPDCGRAQGPAPTRSCRDGERSLPAGGRLRTRRFVIPSLPRDLLVFRVAAMKPRFIVGFFLAVFLRQGINPCPTSRPQELGVHRWVDVAAADDAADGAIAEAFRVGQ